MIVFPFHIHAIHFYNLCLVYMITSTMGIRSTNGTPSILSLLLSSIPSPLPPPLIHFPICRRSTPLPFSNTCLYFDVYIICILNTVTFNSYLPCWNVYMKSCFKMQLPPCRIFIKIKNTIPDYSLLCENFIIYSISFLFSSHVSKWLHDM